VRFEFDLRKSRLNWERHGIDFEDAQALWEESHVISAAKTVADEVRYTLLALMNGYLWIVDHKTSVPRTLSFGRMDHGEFLWQGMVNLHIVRAHLRRIGINVSIEGFIVQRIARRIPTMVDLQVLTIPARAYEETPRVMAQIIRARRAVDVAISEAQNLSATDQFDLLPTPPAYWACGTRYGPCAYTPVCYAERPEDRLIILKANYEKVR